MDESGAARPSRERSVRAGDGTEDAAHASVAHLTTNHAPQDTRVFLKECRTLARAGYDVTLVVPGDGDVVRDGVAIRTVPRPSDRRERMLRTSWRVYRRAVESDARIVHLHDSELIPVGWLLKIRGRRVVFDAHEDRPKQVLSKAWIRPALRPLVAAATRLVEAASARVFDRVVAATPAIAANFPARTTRLVQNFPFVSELQAPEGTPYLQRPHQLAFVGGINAIRGIEQMVDAMEYVPDTLDARLVLAGRFEPPELESAVAERPGWRHVRALGWRSRTQVAELLASARAGLVLYHPAPNHVAAQPNKLFEYMSAGVPVVASDFPLWREIVERAGCGLLVDPLDPRAIGEAIAWILEHPAEARAMGERGRDAVATTFNWDRESRTLLDMYAELSA
jgi:glycosyltransferase involved in cell wall biosynthesis